MIRCAWRTKGKPGKIKKMRKSLAISLVLINSCLLTLVLSLGFLAATLAIEYRAQPISTIPFLVIPTDIYIQVLLVMRHILPKRLFNVRHIQIEMSSVITGQTTDDLQENLSETTSINAFKQSIFVA